MLRAWLILCTMGAIMVALLIGKRNLAIAILTNSIVLHLVQVVVLIVGFAMVVLVADAWRLSRPQDLLLGHRVKFGVAGLVVMAILATTTWNGALILGAQAGMWGTVLGGGGKTQAHDGRINVLLLGGDAGADREGMRFDSITVASVHADTGRTVLFSLPRNLEGAVFSAGSPLRSVYPNGYECPDHSCMLNAIYTLGHQRADLYPDADDPGVQATIEAVEGTLGLSLNYYALIDMLGFQTLIDALGGVNLDILAPVGLAGSKERAKVYLQPGKNVHLNGTQALWFVRSRNNATDYDRMARQKCVMNAVLKQVSPQVVLTNFTALSQAGKEIVRTNVPSSAAGQLLDLAGKARDLPVSSVSFTPPLVYPGNPKIAVIHDAVKQAIVRSESADEAGPKAKKATPSATVAKTPAPRPPAAQPAGKTAANPASPAGRATSAGKGGTPAPTTDDLAAVCSVP